jgi:hypothetical protein
MSQPIEIEGIAMKLAQFSKEKDATAQQTYPVILTVAMWRSHSVSCRPDTDSDDF